MSHAGSWRAACNLTIGIPLLQLEFHEEARGVTDPGVGSSALFGKADSAGATAFDCSPGNSLPIGRPHATRNHSHAELGRVEPALRLPDMG